MTPEFLNPGDLVVVTGGAGYVGAHLVPSLLDKGLRVRVLETFLYGSQGAAEFASHPNVEIVYGDICNIRDLMHVTKGARAVIALAALVGDGACDLDPAESVAINVESTKLLCQAVKHRPDIERVVFASSCSVYGATEGLILNEGSRLNPVSFYARSRIVSEDILRRELEGRSFVVLRLGTVFGVSKRPRLDLMINTMTTRALTTGKITVMGGGAWRPHVHVQDVAKAFRLAVEGPARQISGETFNVGSDENNFTIADVAEMVAARIPGTVVEHVDTLDDLRSYRVSFDKIRHVMGFTPDRTIDEGIDEVRHLLEVEKVDPTDSRYSNLLHLKTKGFGGEGQACLDELYAAIGKVA
ncbi:MAG: nucleoside-diphosphate-sugar epimerase [Hyphomicrobiaceae bacterium]|jgi:nucleoside-diphosphate-sugar epimerase